MADERLRKLERRWRETGSVSDEAAWLRERLRCGEKCACCGGRNCLELECAYGACTHSKGCPPCPECDGLSLQEKLKLAAYCGSEAARFVVPEQPDGDSSLYVRDEDYPGAAMFASWTRGLVRYSHATCVRAAVAAARVTQVHQCYEHDPSCTRTRCAPILRSVKAAEAWLVKPTDELRLTWIFMADEIEHVHWVPLLPGAPGFEHETALAIVAAASFVGERPIRAAIRTEVVPWALGYGDPVRKRVYEREAKDV